MFGNIIPATAFTVATAAPATLPSAFDFLGTHTLTVAFLAAAAVLVVVVRGFALDARQHRSIRSAHRQWELTGQPVAGWGPGWAWSPRPPAEPAEQPDEEDQEDEEPAVALCESCGQHPVTASLQFTDGPAFGLCASCAPVALVRGRAS